MTISKIKVGTTDHDLNASKLTTARTISLTGGVTGFGSFDGSSNLSIATSLSSHPHGNITNAGAIGTAANKAVITTTNGVLTTGTVPVASGGTGATDAAGARANLGLTPISTDFINSLISVAPPM